MTKTVYMLPCAEPTCPNMAEQRRTPPRPCQRSSFYCSSCTEDEIPDDPEYLWDPDIDER